jgi:F-type H+-transporting ATPase subunit gamma
MAKARAIVKRLKAVRNIRKITRTMELVATAKFKKAMDRATEAAAYTRKMGEIVTDLSAALEASGETQISHPLLAKHATESKVVVLVLTSNRGLCGGYNAGVLRIAQQRLRELAGSSSAVQLEVSGKRGNNFFRFQKQPVQAAYTHFEDKTTFEQVNELAQRLIDDYVAGRIDRLDVVSVHFESIARQRPALRTLLPIGKLMTSAAKSESQRVSYEFLPSPQEILDEIVPASFKAQLFKCFLDAIVSEQVFRMVAMKSATENAGEMISSLKAQYNRARQSQITSELSEIIGGAAALE